VQHFPTIEVSNGKNGFGFILGDFSQSHLATVVAGAEITSV
jgi:hypothetical protein